MEPAALEDLGRHTWTGNIRELRNVVERLVILSGPTITAADVKTYVLPKG
jgi:DNA-binding NtrC family response regulator